MMNESRATAVKICGLVLAGGQSRRFGRDKAAIEVAEEPLLSRTARILQSVLDDVFVSVRGDQIGDELRSQFKLIPDEDEGLGPAGGILAAHGQRPHSAWLVVACDMPLLDANGIRRLIERRAGHRAATAYRNPADGLPEPLCAIYEPDTLARFQRQAAAGKGLSPRALLTHADVELIDPQRPELLSNVNTLDDLDRLTGAVESRPGGAKIKGGEL